MSNLEKKSIEELEELINSMTHQMYKVGCYKQQHTIYQELQPVWNEYHRRTQDE